MKYCKTASELSEVLIFQPGNFKIIDAIARHADMSNQEVMVIILPYFRYDSLVNNITVNAESIHDEIYHDEQLGLCQAPNEITALLNSKATLTEITEIAHQLKAHWFFRDDGPAYVAAFTSLFNTNYDRFRLKEMPYDDIYDIAMKSDWYEGISPLADSKIREKIFEALEKILTPSQYGMIKFFINGTISAIQWSDWNECPYWDEYATNLTEQETELLKCALTNIRRSKTLLQALINFCSGVKIF